MSRSTTRSTAGGPPAPSALLLDRAVIQRQLGHTNLGITSIYLRGIDSAEIIDTVHAARPSTARCCPDHPPAGGRRPMRQPPGGPPPLPHLPRRRSWWSVGGRCAPCSWHWLDEPVPG